MAAEFCGTALGGAVEVVLDERGRVIEVGLSAKLLGRLWPEQLGQGVVQAHAQATRQRGR
jgi:DNA-binding protein YbaB